MVPLTLKYDCNWIFVQNSMRFLEKNTEFEENFYIEKFL